MRGVQTVDIPAIHPRLKVGHHTHSPESKVTIVTSFKLWINYLFAHLPHYAQHISSSNLFCFHCCCVKSAEKVSASLSYLRLPKWNILIPFLTWNYRDVYKKAVVNIINSTMEITAKTTKLLAIIKYARLFPFTHQSNFAHRSITKKDGGVVQEAVGEGRQDCRR